MDIAAWNTLLDCVYGPARAAGAPDSFEVMLLATEDPSSEIPGTTDVDEVPVVNGYEPGTLNNDDWLASDGGVKTSFPVDVGTPTEAWETARFVALRDPATATVWNVRPLAEPLTVTGAGTPVVVRVSVAAGSNFDG